MRGPKFLLLDRQVHARRLSRIWRNPEMRRKQVLARVTLNNMNYEPVLYRVGDNSALEEVTKDPEQRGGEQTRSRESEYPGHRDIA